MKIALPLHILHSRTDPRDIFTTFPSTFPSDTLNYVPSITKNSPRKFANTRLLHGNSNFTRRNSGKSSCLSITGDYTVTTLSLRANAILRREYRSFAAKRRRFVRKFSGAAIKARKFPENTSDRGKREETFSTIFIRAREALL